ncbi:MAG: hypothetical protein KKD21_04610 [Proteobacteria bacterium]|nr:hypothetical protein [Pseudomonadota bacterium]MBU1696313.1 hypothetical protein [Pseudomonadota bacterium]
MMASEKSMKIDFKIFIFILFFIGIQSFGSIVPAAQKNDQNPNNLPAPTPPKPQFFCGYCHVITYPTVVQKSYELWKKDKHKDVGCVACHYPPGTMENQTLTKSHIPAMAPDRFSYLSLGGETVQTRPRIKDESCMTSACHGKPEDQFKTKKIKFTEKVTFVHNSHLDPEKQIEGQKIQCVSCHQHETSQKKFEVTKDSCHQCHFTNVKFNQDRGKCTLCHELPTKPIQTSGEKPITHEILEKAGVACASCHIDLIQASGGGKIEAYFEKGVLQTAIILGAGTIKKENCSSCHDRPEQLKEDTNKKLMHEKHVTVKNARCFDCHRPITHAKSGTKATEKEPNGKLSLTSTIETGCISCHLEPHQYQVTLAKGEKRKDVLDAIDPMYKVRTNCFGCHNEFKSTDNGQMVLGASEKTCVNCHTKDHKKMFEDWQKELSEEIKFVGEVEQQVLAKIRAKFGKAEPVEVMKKIQEGRENLKIVRYGNGVHNKKYSMMLLDAAVNSFEDLIDSLEKDQLKQ